MVLISMWSLGEPPLCHIVCLRTLETSECTATRFWMIVYVNEQRAIQNKHTSTHIGIFTDIHTGMLLSYGSVGVETPVPARSPKLSNVEPG